MPKLLESGALPARRASVPHQETTVRLSTGDMLRYDSQRTDEMDALYMARQGIHYSGGVWYCRRQEMLVMACNEPTDAFGSLLHVSMSCKNRLLRWDEVTAIKDVFFGKDIDAMMVLPQEIDYVNLSKNCFHLWQTPAVWGIR